MTDVVIYMMVELTTDVYALTFITYHYMWFVLKIDICHCARMAKGRVCKTVLCRFDSGYSLNHIAGWTGDGSSSVS